MSESPDAPHTPKLPARSGAGVLLHIGYHKTATTWMQRRLFTSANGFRVLLDHQDVHDAIVAPPTILGDDIGPCPTSINEMGDDTAIPVVSSEILCGNPFTGGREADLYARRLRRLFPRAKVLIVIRQQHDAIASTYMQYVRRCGTKSLANFLHERSIPGYFNFSHNHFEYHRLIVLYVELFGRENVAVMTFEHFILDRIDFVENLIRFCGNTTVAVKNLDFGVEGAGDTEALCFLLRRINHFRYDAAHREPVVDLGPAATAAYRALSYAGRHTPWLAKRRPIRDAVRRMVEYDFGPSNGITRQFVQAPQFMSRYPE